MTDSDEASMHVHLRRCISACARPPKENYAIGRLRAVLPNTMPGNDACQRRYSLTVLSSSDNHLSGPLNSATAATVKQYPAANELALLRARR